MLLDQGGTEMLTEYCKTEGTASAYIHLCIARCILFIEQAAANEGGETAQEAAKKHGPDMLETLRLMQRALKKKNANVLLPGLSGLINFARRCDLADPMKRRELMRETFTSLNIEQVAPGG